MLEQRVARTHGRISPEPERIVELEYGHIPEPRSRQQAQKIFAPKMSKAVAGVRVAIKPLGVPASGWGPLLKIDHQEDAAALENAPGLGKSRCPRPSAHMMKATRPDHEIQSLIGKPRLLRTLPHRGKIPRQC